MPILSLNILADDDQASPDGGLSKRMPGAIYPITRSNFILGGRQTQNAQSIGVREVFGCNETGERVLSSRAQGHHPRFLLEPGVAAGREPRQSVCLFDRGLYAGTELGVVRIARPTHWNAAHIGIQAGQSE